MPAFIVQRDLKLTRNRSSDQPLRAHPAGDRPGLESQCDSGVADAIAAGLTDVVSPTPLITMLTALRPATR